MADDKSSSAPIPTAMAVPITQMNPKDREKFYDELEFPFCDEVNKYEKMAKIGQGTFGEVFKARHKKNKKIVALKKVLMENEKEANQLINNIQLILIVILVIFIVWFLTIDIDFDIFFLTYTEDWEIYDSSLNPLKTESATFFLIKKI